MIAISTAPYAHSIGDVAAWAGAALASLWQHKHWPDQAQRLSQSTEPSYFLSLALCALAGAWLWGSANTLQTSFSPSHSIAGALAGGVVGVEAWKWRRGVRESTGGAFVLPICVGVVIGRLGCLFSGLPDYTYGRPTSLPWAIDLGDGIGRHPVQIYESLSMAIFLLVYLSSRHRGSQWAERRAFYAMIIVYACQRFAWEFLKPYPTVLGPMNVFHLLMMGLFAYGIIWWRRAGDDFVRAGGSSGHARGRALHLPRPDDEPVRDMPRAGSSQGDH